MILGHLPIWKTGFFVPAPSLRGPDVPPIRGQSYATLRTFVGLDPFMGVGSHQIGLCRQNNVRYSAGLPAKLGIPCRHREWVVYGI